MYARSRRSFLYVPYEQGEADFLTQSAFFVRARGEQSAIVNGIRAVVKQMDANVPVESIARHEKKLISNSMRAGPHDRHARASHSACSPRCWRRWASTERSPTR